MTLGRVTAAYSTATPPVLKVKLTWSLYVGWWAVGHTVLAEKKTKNHQA